MGATKRLIGLGSSGLVRLFRPLEGNAWLTAATLTGLGLLGLASYHLWHRYADRIVLEHRYRLDPSKMVVTPQPDWIRTDVAANAVTYGQLRDASLLDPRLVLQVKQAFGVQPWVRSVKRVNKRFPSTVEVELEYRRLVAMVEVPKGMFPAYDYEGLLPVDVEGYLLPPEVNEQEATSYPKIAGIDTSPAGPYGTPWGDVRVAQAAQIIELLSDVWSPLQLLRVEVPPRHSAVDAPVLPASSFVLVTHQRRRFDWGSPPGQERPGEDSAAQKLAVLKAYLHEHGTLDSLAPEQTSQSARIPGLRYASVNGATSR